MNLTHLIVASLATWEILELWRHGSLFAGARAVTDLWYGWIGTLLRCPFCSAPYVALICVTLLQIPGWPGTVTSFLVWAMAAARGANLANDLFHGISRTPHEGLDDSD
ncbi:MAG: DUF1360 domain-containing protein [Planctomycetota bacterium]